MADGSVSRLNVAVPGQSLRKIHFAGQADLTPSATPVVGNGTLLANDGPGGWSTLPPNFPFT